MFSEAHLSDFQPDPAGPRYVQDVWNGGVAAGRLRHGCLFGAQRGGAAGFFPRVLPRRSAGVQEHRQSGAVQGDGRQECSLKMYLMV